ncbi:hypothetical protein MDOR_21920 [Mycolicibacterium doricum]|uniref:Uncharacterized protein n=1 Tax=Mycolicibacterium doricum TaxID=126673 RepID=A0A1X1TK52_9MYCO|nr:hypothetical protein [Mycolicibacterium doricum]ORV44971.1 hypothetical protein AWC01_02740 [Mycolicibacterium doricum]BBZ08023.1 hypothetical protein MDOR_21920 [Mycolicibacterium doricum]
MSRFRLRRLRPVLRGAPALLPGRRLSLPVWSSPLPVRLRLHRLPLSLSRRQVSRIRHRRLRVLRRVVRVGQ